MSGARVGIQLGATTAPQELGDVASEAERLGYSEIWLAEDYFQLGGISSAAIALAATQRIPVGLGVVAAAARHPAASAMEFATLGTTHAERFMAGLGHGAPEWVRQMGLEPASPMRLLREATDAIRQLLGGAEVTQAGDYFEFDRVRLHHPPPTPIPLYLGVHGPASLRLSGELGNGTLLGWFSSPGYVTWARERIEEGRARGERTDPHSLVVLCVLSISEDNPDGARERLGIWGARMLLAMAKSTQLKSTEEGQQLSAFIESDPERARNTGPPPSLLERFAAVGDRTSCAATIDRLLEAGADRVVLVPNPAGYRSTPEMVRQMQAGAALIRT